MTDFVRQISVVNPEGDSKWLTLERCRGKNLQIRKCCGTCKHWKQENPNDGWCGRIKILTWIGDHACQLRNKWEYHRTPEELEELIQEKDTC